jgi:hypothetical protein
MDPWHDSWEQKIIWQPRGISLEVGGKLVTTKEGVLLTNISTMIYADLNKVLTFSESVIYIDTPSFAKGKKWSHLFIAHGDIAVLHYFAKRIGLKRCWFQNHPSLPHYDVHGRMFEKAIRAGASLVSRSVTAQVIRDRRG